MQYDRFDTSVISHSARGNMTKSAGSLESSAGASSSKNNLAVESDEVVVKMEVDESPASTCVYTSLEKHTNLEATDSMSLFLKTPPPVDPPPSVTRPEYV
ncbi:hypothetical protein COOONC_03113 [Cooperia oncophora]